MFKQFVQNFTDSQTYLIFSLFLFLIFFLMVGVMLYRMKKKDVDYMSNIPLEEDQETVPGDDNAEGQDLDQDKNQDQTENEIKDAKQKRS